MEVCLPSLREDFPTKRGRNKSLCGRSYLELEDSTDAKNRGCAMLLAQRLYAPLLTLPCSLTIISFKFGEGFIRNAMTTSWLCAAGQTVLLQLLLSCAFEWGRWSERTLLSLLRVARHRCGSSRLIHAYSYLWREVSLRSGVGVAFTQCPVRLGWGRFRRGGG